MLRTVLAPTDLSLPARQAVERAAQIAQASGAGLVLQHALHSGALETLRRLFASAPADLQQRLLDEAHGELRTLAAELDARYATAADVHLGAGDVVAAIVAQADALDAGLLVLGARGASLVHDPGIGSTTERVLRQTARPLLVVRHAAHPGYRRVLVAVDFSACSRKAIHLAMALAPHAELVLLHAFAVPFAGRLRHAGVGEDELALLRDRAGREAAEQMAELIAAAALEPDSVRAVLVHGEAGVHILDQEQLQGCELIAIGKCGQGPLEELLLGSVTRHILALAHGDVLVV